MGRRLNLSHLSEAECEHILNVVHKDFNIRYMEKERLRQIEEDVQEEETKYSVLSKSRVFNEKNCICCFSRFILLFNPRILCDFCRFNVCKKCVELDDEEKKTRCCKACLKQRQLKNQSNEWFYSSVERKFKRCGSAKVIRSLYKRRLIDDGSRSMIVMKSHSDCDSASMTHHHRWHSNDDETHERRVATLPRSFTMTTGDAVCDLYGGRFTGSAFEGQGHTEDRKGLGEDGGSMGEDSSLDGEEEVGGVTAANHPNSQSAQRKNRVGCSDCSIQTDESRMGLSEMGTMTVAEEASRCLAGFDGMSTVSTEGHETDPQFVQRPHNIRVLEAEPLVVECQVNGTEPLDVLWFCNRNQVQQLEEDERCEMRRHGNVFSLTLFEMRPSDSLDYLCIAVNAIGQCAQGFTVAVDANAHASMCPQFTSPSDVVEIVPEGGEAVLRCSLCAYPEPKVTWYRNNKKLMHGGRIRTESHVPDALQYSLVIDGVRSEDSGSYSAIASNVAGQTRLSLQLLVQPNVSETRSDEAGSVPGADLHSNEDDLMRLAVGVSRTQGKYTTTATRMLRSADAMSSMQSQLDEMDRTLEDLEGEVLDVISDDDEDEDSANNNNSISRQLIDDIDDMKSSAEAVGMVTSAALQLLSSAKELALETLHRDGDKVEEEEEEEEEEKEEEAEEEEEEEEKEECVDAEELSLSYQELEKLFEVGLISRSQLKNRLIQRRDIKHIRSFLQSTMSSALKDSAGHAHTGDVDQSESSSAMDTSADSLEGREESVWKKMKKNGGCEDGEKRGEERRGEMTSLVDAAGDGVDGEAREEMVDNQLLKKTEEQIYLTSGKVFSLEDCIRDLERQVLQVDDDTPTETLASLENSVARAVAQVTQSDHEVNDIERQVTQWLKNSNKNTGGCNEKSNQQKQQLLKSDSETEKKKTTKKKKKIIG